MRLGREAGPVSGAKATERKRLFEETGDRSGFRCSIAPVVKAGSLGVASRRADNQQASSAMAINSFTGKKSRAGGLKRRPTKSCVVSRG